MHDVIYAHIPRLSVDRLLLLPQMLSFLLIVMLSRLRPTVLLQHEFTNTDTVAQNSAQVGVPAPRVLIFFSLISNNFISCACFANNAA